MAVFPFTVRWDLCLKLQNPKQTHNMWDMDLEVTKATMGRGEVLLKMPETQDRVFSLKKFNDWVENMNQINRFVNIYFNYFFNNYQKKMPERRKRYLKYLRN